MNPNHLHSLKPISLATTLLAALLLTACGGGGGGGGGGGTTPPPPPPPPPATTYSVSLTGVVLTDRQTDDTVIAAGLPIDGATATRSP